MRYAVLVLGILGGLSAAMLGIKWVSDASEHAATIAQYKEAGVDTSEVTRLTVAGWLLIAGLFGGVAGGVLAIKRKGKAAGATMLAAAVLPAFFAPASLIFTFLMLVGGGLGFLVKPQAAAAVA